MKTAILSDIHSNLEALTACMAHARRQGAGRFVFLGDLVGYGADPVACLDLIREELARGGRAVRGNHDEAALGGLCENLNFIARDSAYWTRNQLGPAERELLAALPLQLREGAALYVHASAFDPAAWEYISGTESARRCLAASDAPIVFAGHVHQPLLFYTVEGGVKTFAATPGVAVPLSSRRRWLVLGGSVGQPRDGNPAAAYQLFDETERSVTYHRVPYDHAAAARKILAAGLPAMLARRLAHGE
ncbi:MAG: metallophosphoesterase family protein [Sulfurisoma sp.]|nr:metallophosphoesterase family protein [Sulfurisoma sp.]